MSNHGKSFKSKLTLTVSTSPSQRKISANATILVLEHVLQSGCAVLSGSFRKADGAMLTEARALMLHQDRKTDIKTRTG